MKGKHPPFYNFTSRTRAPLRMTRTTKLLIWGRVLQVTFAITIIALTAMGITNTWYLGNNQASFWQLCPVLYGAALNLIMAIFGIVSLTRPDKLHWSVMFALDCVGFVAMSASLGLTINQRTYLGWGYELTMAIQSLTIAITAVLAISSVVRRLSIKVIPDDTELPPSLSKDIERDSWYPADEIPQHQHFVPVPPSQISFAPNSHYAPSIPGGYVPSIHGHYAPSIRSTPSQRGSHYIPPSHEYQSSLDRAAVNKSPVPTRALSEIGTARPWSLMSGTLTHAPSVMSAAPSYWKT